MRGFEATTIEEVLALPDEEIDIATAILLLSKQWDSTVDIEKYSKRIDRMATSLRPMIAQAQTPRAVVRIINDYIFEKSGYSALEENESFLLHWVLDKKRGNCMGLSILYLSLAQRLKLPIYGVDVPDHMFVRYDDGETKINIETANKGRSNSDVYYIRDRKVPTKTRNWYLCNLNKKETIACFMNTLGNAFRTRYECDKDRSKLDKAAANLKTAIEINPSYAEAHSNLGTVHLSRCEPDKAIAECNIAIGIRPNFPQAYGNLGLAYKDKAIAHFEKFISQARNDCDLESKMHEVKEWVRKLRTVGDDC